MATILERGVGLPPDVSESTWRKISPIGTQDENSVQIEMVRRISQLPTHPLNRLISGFDGPGIYIPLQELAEKTDLSPKQILRLTMPLEPCFRVVESSETGDVYIACPTL